MTQENTAEELYPATYDDNSATGTDVPSAGSADSTAAAGPGATAAANAAAASPDDVTAPGPGADSVPAQARVSANASGGTSSIADIAMIGNIPVNLSMEIGRTSLTIAELMSLGKGSVVELQRMADEPLDVLVNGTLVAHGEAVVVGDRFGIRLTDVVSEDERLGRLG